MLTNILRGLMWLIVAFIVWEVVKIVLVTLGIILPAIVVTLIGLLILVAVVLYIVKLFGF